MRKNPLVPADDELDYGDYLCDERREERAEEQAEMFDRPLPEDTYTLLRLFENHRGIDVPQDWFDLKQHYHGALDDPKSRESWSSARLNRALDDADARGLVVYRNKWEITAAGLEARKAEYERRVRG